MTRYGDMMSRPGSMMMMGGGPGYIASRPGSRTGSRPTSGQGPLSSSVFVSSISNHQNNLYLHVGFHVWVCLCVFRHTSKSYPSSFNFQINNLKSNSCIEQVVYFKTLSNKIRRKAHDVRMLRVPLSLNLWHWHVQGLGAGRTWVEWPSCLLWPRPTPCPCPACGPRTLLTRGMWRCLSWRGWSTSTKRSSARWYMLHLRINDIGKLINLIPLGLWVETI